MKPRKVTGRSTSPEGRAVLHEAVDESLVCGQELRCAKEGLCMMESVTGFGGQLGNMAFPGKVMADRETQKLEKSTSSRGLLRKWMGRFSKRSFRRDIVRV